MIFIPKFSKGDKVKHLKSGFDGIIADVKVEVTYTIKGANWTVLNAQEHEIERGLFNKKG